MITQLESFWKEKRKIKINGSWLQLGDRVDDKYIPENGTSINVTVVDGIVTFLKRDKSASNQIRNDTPPTEGPKSTFEQASEFKPKQTTRHAAGSGLTNEEIVATLNQLCAENEVFATQTHFEGGKWSYVAWIR